MYSSQIGCRAVCLTSERTRIATPPLLVVLGSVATYLIYPELNFWHFVARTTRIPECNFERIGIQGAAVAVIASLDRSTSSRHLACHWLCQAPWRLCCLHSFVWMPAGVVLAVNGVVLVMYC
ncbi:PREDICTED: uncharacterized protein LOC108617857 [Drosophila arizonae]|uniref:Uncharacterized protein LOC108617857 n=1 Tax=Drosophila arizonae TaxID=7263 RepID=A0ABM1PPP8_DROAR|nr:PREDICTED: uncharacterized protein LOC108617857 [Drosophila arizonae]